MSNTTTTRLGNTKGIALINKNMSYYDQAVSKALVLTFEDPSDQNEEEVQKKQRQTDNLLQKFPVQPFKADFIDGFKIRGRQKPITDFRTDLKDRLKQIGGGIGEGLFEEQLENDDSRQNINVSPFDQKQSPNAHKSSISVNKNVPKNGATTNQAQKEKDIEQKMLESSSGFISDPKKLSLDKIRDITRKVQAVVLKDEQKKIQNLEESGKAQPPQSSAANRVQSASANDRGSQSPSNKKAEEDKDETVPEDTINPEKLTKVYQLKDQIDQVVKHRIDHKNARQIKLGRKIVDKEGDLYNKLLFFPEIKEPVVRKKPTQDFHKETMLFKANAVRLSDFIAKRMSEKYDYKERLNKMYNDSFADSSIGAPISHSTKHGDSIGPIMFLDASSTYIEQNSGSQQQVFITSTDYDEEKNPLGPKRSRNSVVSQSIAIPQKVKGSPLKEAIYLTNQSVRKFKFMSSYSKAGLGDALSQNSSFNQDSVASTLHQASKEHVNKLRGMINLPKIQKKGGQNVNDLSSDDQFNGDYNGGMNRLSMIKEMMESTTQLMISANPSPKTFSTTQQPNGGYNDDLVQMDSPRLSNRQVNKIPSRRFESNHHLSGQGQVGQPMRHLSTNRQNSLYKASFSKAPSPNLVSPLGGGFSLNKMNDSLDFSSQLMGKPFSGTGAQKLQRQMAKQIENTKDLRACINSSIEQIKQDLVSSNIQTEENALRHQLQLRMKTKIQLSLGMIQTDEQKMASLLGINLQKSSNSDSQDNLNGSNGFSNQGSPNKKSSNKLSVQGSPTRRGAMKSKESKLNVIFEVDLLEAHMNNEARLRQEATE